VHGVELGASWRFWAGFTAFGGFAWLEGENDVFVGAVRTRAPMSRIQPAWAIVGLRWDAEDGRWWLEGTVTVAGRQDRLSPGDAGDTQRIPPGGTPGYTIYTLRGGMTVWDSLRLFAAVENITDKDYRVHGSGVNEPGTNAVLGLHLTF
jgi:hemoglobin/transferrin/lactoferrin receptor protein